MHDMGARPLRSLALWIIQLLVAIVLWILVWSRVLSIPHCGLQCNTALLSAAVHFFGLFCIFLVVLTGIATMFLRAQRWSWMIPAAGICLLVVGAFVAYDVSSRALLF